MLPLALSVLLACSSTTVPAGPPSGPSAASPAPVAVAPAPVAAAPALVAAVPPGPARLITGAGVRVRSAADAAAPEVVKLSLGDLVTELEVSPQRVKVGGQEDVWVRVRTAAGQEGWVFGALTEHVEPTSRVDAIVRLAEPRITAETKVFTDLADLVLSLERLLPGLQGEAALQIRWTRLRALGAALEALGGGEVADPGRKGFIEAHQDLVFYDEIGGRWIVASKHVEALATEASGTALAEPIRWSAAQWPRGGECEGDPFCMLGYFLLTDGVYLAEFPKGPHAAEAIEHLRGTLRYIAQDAEVLPTDGQESREILGHFSKVQSIVQASAPGDKALGALLDGARARYQKAK